MADLLLELFSEEIPASMQGRASADLQRLVTGALVDAGLTYARAAAFATPRRLTLAIEGLSDASPTLREQRRGPRVDAPEKALEGFLRGVGLGKEQLTQSTEKKGTFWMAEVVTEGRANSEIVAEVLPQIIQNFPWPKSMRWGAGSLKWVRPLHSILCILSDEAGAQVVPFEVAGIASGDVTKGHRFMAPEAFSVTSFVDYAAKLKRAHVVLDPVERADAIWAEATNQAFAAGLEVVEDKGLLVEVAGLVEWPVPLMGKIDDAFLDLPPEVLQTSMKEHQKFFSVRDKSGKIVRFVTVANRETSDQGATILAGNNKVLSARLADAAFFWNNDLAVARAGMGDWAQSLENVTFHNKLGSQAERIKRIAALARTLAPAVGADPDLAAEAAEVAKLDLSSEMVYEFPELQGLMGRYYSDAAGRDAAVASACQDHYSPLGPSDTVPTAPVSVTVALADKLDLLTGFWAIDEKPTGSKDPFALRRAALGVIRLVLENGVRFSQTGVHKGVLERVAHSIQMAAASDPKNYHALNHGMDDFAAEDDWPTFRSDPKNAAFVRALDYINQEESVDYQLAAEAFEAEVDDLLSFFHDRLKVFLRDQGITHDVIDACLAMPGNDDLVLLVNRATALQDTMRTEDGENLVQGYKRASNILEQAEAKDGVEYSLGANRKFAEGPEETALFDALDAANAVIAPALEAEDFSAAMTAMATLRGPIDAFFEAVQVNADSEILRRNRLNLLSAIRATCSQVADLGKLGG